MTGTCFERCISFILNLPLEGMPSVHPPFREWFKEWQQYLHPMGLALTWIPNTHPEPEGYAILILEDEPCPHAVVVKDREIIFNPPRVLTNAETARRLHWYVFTVLNPREMVEGER